MQIGIGFLSGLIATAFPSLVRAEPPEAGGIAVVVDPATRSCVRPEELSRSIASAGRLKARPAEPGSVAKGEIELHVAGTPAALTVTLGGLPQPVSQTLSATSCEAASEVISAFVDSVVAPQAQGSPPNATERRAAPTAVEAQREVDRALEQQGVQLASLGLRLSFSVNADGEWFLELSSNQARCTVSRFVGGLPELTVPRVERLAQLTRQLIQERPKCLERDPPRTLDTRLGDPPAPGYRPGRFALTAGAGFHWGLGGKVRIGDRLAGVFTASVLPIVASYGTSDGRNGTAQRLELVAPFHVSVNVLAGLWQQNETRLRVGPGANFNAALGQGFALYAEVEQRLSRRFAFDVSLGAAFYWRGRGGLQDGGFVPKDADFSYPVELQYGLNLAISYLP